MKLVYLSNPNVSTSLTVSELNSDETIKVDMDCASDVFAGSASLPPPVTYETIAVCRRVDSSNFCVRIAPPPLGLTGYVYEIYADGGAITIFATNAAGAASTFLDGSSSISTTTGVRLRWLNNKWAAIN